MRLRIPIITLLLLVATISVWSLPRSADRDQDGVADKFDKCKDTPSRTKVDKSGCTIVEKKKATGCRPKINGEAEDLGNGMVSLPSGCFCMGSNDGEDNEKPVHRVCLSAFSMDKYEVTRLAFMEIQGRNPHENDDSCYVMERGYLSSYFLGNTQPQVCVDWNQAKEYCESQGKRLPTEAEWEYAARAGTTSKWNCGNDESCLDHIAWYSSNSHSKTNPIGQKQPNDWGLYDMAGNVWEWTSDLYSAYSSESQQDPRGASSGLNRVFRGGSWYETPLNQRSAVRAYLTPTRRGEFLGFRCVASISK